jgi:hyaluronan synthase
MTHHYHSIDSSSREKRPSFSSDLSTYVHIVLTVLPSLTVCAAIIWSYVTSRRSAKTIGVYYVTIYGCIALVNYVTQFMFACLERRQSHRLASDLILNTAAPYSIAAQVVGYREDALYFKNCLESIAASNYHYLQRIIVVIDGNGKEDEYMARICETVFGKECKVLRLPRLMSPDSPIITEALLAELVDPYASYRTLCIMQPHAGKRNAIYTATRISMRYAYDCVFNTDSDTVVMPDCFDRLSDVLRAKPEVAAVAGALEIFNAHESILARMSHARYFFAFNVERAAQSYFGCVQCISGPCGLYRTDAIGEVLDDWMQQTFLGKPCAAGDDRHLTACILGTGQQVKFTHLAVVRTETPITYVRWLKQQTRWMKSSLREALYCTVHVLSKQSFYATYELMYYTLLPFGLIATMMLMALHHHTLSSAVGLLIASMLIPTVRAIVCYLLLERRIDLLWIAFYGPLYMSALLPAKLYALATLGDITWGTGTRKQGSLRDKCDGVVVAVMLWNAGLLIAYIVRLYRN